MCERVARHASRQVYQHILFNESFFFLEQRSCSGGQRPVGPRPPKTSLSHQMDYFYYPLIYIHIYMSYFRQLVDACRRSRLRRCPGLRSYLAFVVTLRWFIRPFSATSKLLASHRRPGVKMLLANEEKGKNKMTLRQASSSPSAPPT